MKERKDKKHDREFGNWSQDKYFFTCLNKWSRASGTSKMNIETLKKYDKKKTIMIITFIILALIILLFSVSLAKYRSSKSINIAKGTVNYKQPDLNLVSIYLEDEDNNYKQASDGKIPTSGYTLNEDITKTRCTIKGEVDNNITITYENGEVSFSKLTTAGTKCYLYFDKIKDTEAPVIGVHEARNIEKTSMDLYVEATDNIGITGYYFKLSTSSDWGETKCANQNNCMYSVSELTDDTSYTYDIKVCDTAGNCSTTKITQKTKFNEIPIPSGTTAATLLNHSGKKQEGLPDFTDIKGDGLYTWTGGNFWSGGDYSNGSNSIQYFRGNVNNNWVVFGKDGTNYIWWRIIRSNSNGSLRMIYAGLSSDKTTAPATTGMGTNAGYSYYNSELSNAVYVGFKYTMNQAHGTGTESTILKSLNTWYNNTLAKNTNYSGKIDNNAGFCNDRETTEGTGTGAAYSEFAGYHRLNRIDEPRLSCNSADVFKIPVGLITADEAMFGGLTWGMQNKNSTSSYLHTELDYWTMTPSQVPFTGDAQVFIVANYPRSGSAIFHERVNYEKNIRPVVNLKSNTLFVAGGAGTSTNPYVVSGT